MSLPQRFLYHHPCGGHCEVSSRNSLKMGLVGPASESAVGRQLALASLLWDCLGYRELPCPRSYLSSDRPHPITCWCGGIRSGQVCMTVQPPGLPQGWPRLSLACSAARHRPLLTPASCSLSTDSKSTAHPNTHPAYYSVLVSASGEPSNLTMATAPSPLGGTILFHSHPLYRLTKYIFFSVQIRVVMNWICLLLVSPHTQFPLLKYKSLLF